VALFDPCSNEYRALRGFTNREYGSLEEIIQIWLRALDETAPTVCCIAAAAPPAEDQVNMINIDWSFSCAELARKCGFERAAWLNDFQANACALPHLQPHQQETLRAGDSRAGQALTVMGPGTGLGGAVLEWVNGQGRARACEPGHMGLSPGTEEELEIFRQLMPRYGEIDAERLVSGSGLLLIYQTLATIHGGETAIQSPAGVSSAALEGDELSVMALDTFCALLGSVCGDFVLANGAYGGMYLAGGIAPRILDHLRGSRFLQRFSAKGDLSDILQRVPVYAVTAAQPGLIGAAHAPL
jgi:glucokinase